VEQDERLRSSFGAAAAVQGMPRLGLRHGGHDRQYGNADGGRHNRLVVNAAWRCHPRRLAAGPRPIQDQAEGCDSHHISGLLMVTDGRLQTLTDTHGQSRCRHADGDAFAPSAERLHPRSNAQTLPMATGWQPRLPAVLMAPLARDGNEPGLSGRAMSPWVTRPTD